MGQIKTAELEGTALDWAVAKCEGYFDKCLPKENRMTMQDYFRVRSLGGMRYSSVWSAGGPIIEREHIGVWEQLVGNKVRWASEIDDDNFAYGHTPLIAAMRCYVASKLGDVIEVPDEVSA